MSRAAVIEGRVRALRWTRIAAVVVVFGWAVYQAFWNLGAANYNSDEPIYVEAGWAYVHGDFSANREHPPTAKLLIGLAQLVLGEGAPAGRILVAVTVLLGGLVLYLWLRREIGWAGALFASGAWMLMPHGVTSGPRLDRFAVLEPFMVFFALCAFAAAWQWFRLRSRAERTSGTRPWLPWVWLVVSAIAMAFSVTSKVSTAVMIPAILLLPLLARRVRDAVIGAVVFVAVFGVVAVGLYLPMGIRSAVTYMLQMQSEHNAAGHLVVVAGVATTDPPWWTNLLYSVEGMGIAASAVLVVGLIAAFWLRPPALTLYVFGGMALLLVFHLFVSRVMLSHYYYVWVWPACVLAGIGVAVLLASRVRLLRLLAGLLVVVAVGSSLWVSAVIANERAVGVALVLPSLEAEGVPDGDVLVGGMAPWEYSTYLEGHWTTDPADPDIVAVATKESLRFPVDPAVEAVVDDDAAEELVLDDVTLYILDETPATAP
ncbi:hypothetical protein [Herbiconiux flava]|uniref:Glycosyltransferase RgtA/B/C/D-like domain-containing protein n=1 Tax=Herbiconiux flava TaxID=881268 RepID=A0A852SRI9_9MICO|nr:hypothetical protein [Herbiconiux flava]NYD71334.1 hypothetical protein [Herbiconiux flava]GLK18702.1 hypothetical protein GCM10017602_31840 [Herbiconiux flava]